MVVAQMARQNNFVLLNPLLSSSLAIFKFDTFPSFILLRTIYTFIPNKVLVCAHRKIVNRTFTSNQRPAPSHQYPSNKRMQLVTFTITLLLSSVFAFAPGSTTRSLQKARRASSPLRVSWWDSEGDSESYQRAMQNNVRRTDFRNFLTQRSLQSFINLLNSCHDPHTVRWIESFGDWKNLEHFHGIGAFNLTRFPTWDTMFLEMMGMPEEIVVVSSRKRGPGHGGGSKNNPYLKVSKGATLGAENFISVGSVNFEGKGVNSRKCRLARV